MPSIANGWWSLPAIGGRVGSSPSPSSRAMRRPRSLSSSGPAQSSSCLPCARHSQVDDRGDAAEFTARLGVGDEEPRSGEAKFFGSEADRKQCSAVLAGREPLDDPA